MLAFRVCQVAPTQSSENARVSPASSIARNLALLHGVVDNAGVVTGLRREHERRHDTGSRARGGEVAQPRTGASNTISCRVDHDGRPRLAETWIQRFQSSASSNGVAPRSNAADQ